MSCMRACNIFTSVREDGSPGYVDKKRDFYCNSCSKNLAFLRVSVMVYMKGVTHREDENVYDECVGFGGWILGFD